MMTNFVNLNEYDKHQTVDIVENKELGALSIVAIHNNSLGPALGGTRVFPYLTTDEALCDVLKLSRAMTYKCAIAGVPFGGGKAVVAANPTQENILEILAWHAEHVTNLGGTFYTGADVGLDQNGVEHMAKHCPYIIGTAEAAGDPSPFAGLSAFLCTQVALEHVYGSHAMKNKKVIIKGVGKTGSKLAELWCEAGADVYITDIDDSSIASFLSAYPRAKHISLAEVYTTPCDVYAPCALSNDINESNAKLIKAQIICGTANNQISSPQIADYLFTKGITYVPDYIANAGGLINVADELMPEGYQPVRVHKNIEQLQKTLKDVLLASKQTKKNPWLIAEKKVEEILDTVPIKNKAVLVSK